MAPWFKTRVSLVIPETETPWIGLNNRDIEMHTRGLTDEMKERKKVKSLLQRLSSYVEVSRVTLPDSLLPWRIQMDVEKLEYKADECLPPSLKMPDIQKWTIRKFTSCGCLQEKGPNQRPNVSRIPHDPLWHPIAIIPNPTPSLAIGRR